MVKELHPLGPKNTVATILNNNPEWYDFPKDIVAQEVKVSRFVQDTVFASEDFCAGHFELYNINLFIVVQEHVRSEQY